MKLRTIHFILLSLLCLSTGLAQTATGTSTTAAGGASVQQILQGLQNKRLARTSSLPLFAARSFSEGEAILEAANMQPAGTPQWHVESGFELEQVAFAIRAQGDAATAVLVAQLALGHLGQADQNFPGASPADVANEKEIIGYIYQSLLGDETTAAQYYQAAVSLSPNTGNSAWLLAQIQRSQTTAAAKLARAAAGE
jgi:hypothetical protein